MSMKTALLSAVVSGILLFLPYPGFNLYLLEWIAFVPLLFAISGRSVHTTYLLGTVTGTVAVFGGFNWVANVAETGVGVSFPLNYLLAFAYALLTGQVFALIAALFQWLRYRSRISELLLFPVVVATVFSLFPILFKFKPGDGQSYLLPAIQAIEFTGVHGLDALLGLVNILIYRLLQPVGGKQLNRAWLLCALIPLLWFGYGIVSLQIWDERIAGWQSKRIGLVQPNREARLGRPEPEPGFSRAYPLEMKLSETLAEANADVIVWPEGHFHGYTFWTAIRRSFRRHIRQMDTPLLIFDATRSVRNGEKHYHNSALHLDRHGKLAGTYHKIKLVPFGEYIPLIGRSELLKMVMGEFLDSLTPGTEYVYFDVAGMKIVPAICYEPLYPEFTAGAIGRDSRGKVLLVQSQDGWYGESAQPEQHMTVTAMRAVENRVPLVHVINNGRSAIILPSGRYVFRSPPFTRGAWVAEMPYNRESGGSFYSRYPYLFIGLIWALFLAAVALRRSDDRSNTQSGNGVEIQ